MKLADALGKNFFELNYPQDLAARLQNAESRPCLFSGQMLRDETPLYRRQLDHNRWWYEYIFVPVFSNNGLVELVAGSTRDITERKDMEQERDRHLQDIQTLNARLKRSMTRPTTE